MLDRLHAELPNTPLLVAEYGVGTDEDAVRGFFHWTAVDNYEWLLGYDVAFGLFDRERKPRPSARVLEREARALR